MRPGHRFNVDVENELKAAIRAGLSARHIPRFIVQVDEIPMTANGKKVETLVRQVVCTGELPKQVSGTVVNPECLKDFQKFYHMERTRAKL